MDHRRPGEEHDHTATDPAELTNLAGQVEHAAIQQRLSVELDRWLTVQHDPAIPLESLEAQDVAQREQHTFPFKR